jgi:hypothetical protein
MFSGHHVTTLSDELKLLLVAGYTCSVSNPHSDYSRYVEERSAKRSKRSSERDHEMYDNCADSHVLPFTFDRLCNVFKLFAESVKHENPSFDVFGEASIFAAVSSIEKLISLSISI